MISKWESEKKRLLRFMKIPPKEKLEWLRQINEFIAKFSTKKQRSIRQKLKQR